MIALDVRTIVLSQCLTSALCAGVLVTLWKSEGRRFGGTGYWAADLACQAAATLLIAMRGFVPDWLSMVVGNTLSVAGAMAGYSGLIVFTGRPALRRRWYLTLAVFASVHAYYAELSPSLAARNLDLSIWLGTLCGLSAWLATRGVTGELKRIMRPPAVVFTAFSAVCAARVLYVLASPRYPTELLRLGVADQVVLLSFQLLQVLLTFSLVLMVADRLRAEVGHQEEKFSKAFRSAPYAVTLTRLSDGAIIEVNERFVELTGYSYDEAVGKTSIDLGLWADEADRGAIVAAVSRGESVRGLELQFMTRTGRRLTGLFSCELIEVNGNPCALSSISDITDRQRAGQELRESQERLRSFVDSLSDLAFIKDQDLAYLAVNAAYASYFGKAEAEIVGRTDSELMLAEQAEQCRRSDEAAIQSGALAVTTETVGERVYETRKFPVKLNGGTVGVGGVIRDMTDQVRAQEQIRNLNTDLERRIRERTAELQASNDELNAFAYSVSHDLRAPLRAVEGFGAILQSEFADKLDAEGSRLIDNMRAAARQMAALIDALLGLSRIARADLVRATVDLSAIARQVAKELQARDPGRSVVFTVQEGVAASADPHLARIVLDNLVGNAWKYTSAQPAAHIEFGMTEAGEILVRDNGVGFDMQYVGALFRPFARLHSSEEFEGTGIGLATVARIISRHGGLIRAVSSPGAGAAFYFTFDACRPDAAADEAVSNRREYAPPAPAQTGD